MRPLLSFFTALPLGAASVEAAARKTSLLPFVGFVTGVPGAAILLLAYVMPSGVSAALALGAVLLAAGLHHTDGVLDAGDALMVRGIPSRRREVLKDARVGVGGIGALFLVYAPTLAALAALAEASPARAALALLAAEVVARSAMLLLLTFGKPAEKTSSTVPFVRALRGRHKTAGVALALAAPFIVTLPLGGFAPLSLFVAPTVALLSLRFAKYAFGGISGDLVGATGETTRAALLVVLSAAL